MYYVHNILVIYCCVISHPKLCAVNQSCSFAQNFRGSGIWIGPSLVPASPCLGPQPGRLEWLETREVGAERFTSKPISHSHICHRVVQHLRVLSPACSFSARTQHLIFQEQGWGCEAVSDLALEVMQLTATVAISPPRLKVRGTDLMSVWGGCQRMCRHV